MRRVGMLTVHTARRPMPLMTMSQLTPITNTSTITATDARHEPPPV